jgi:hypothetical protein
MMAWGTLCKNGILLDGSQAAWNAALALSAKKKNRTFSLHEAVSAVQDLSNR